MLGVVVCGEQFLCAAMSGELLRFVGYSLSAMMVSILFVCGEFGDCRMESAQFMD